MFMLCSIWNKYSVSFFIVYFFIWVFNFHFTFKNKAIVTCFAPVWWHFFCVFYKSHLFVVMNIFFIFHSFYRILPFNIIKIDLVLKHFYPSLIFIQLKFYIYLTISFFFSSLKSYHTTFCSQYQNI